MWGRLKRWLDGAAQPQPVRRAEAAGAPLMMLDTGGHMALIKAVAFTPDGRQLVSASDDKTIRVWDLATGETVRIIRGESALGHPGKIYAMALSLDGKWLAAGGDIGDRVSRIASIRLYEFATGTLVTLLNGHEDVVHRLAFSPDSRHLISGSSDSTAIVWDVASRYLKHRLRGHTDSIYAVGFTPDGRCVVTGSLDHDLRLWRVTDGGEVARMTGHGDKVRTLAVATNGTIASGDPSGEIRLWDGRTGAAAEVLARQVQGVGSLSFSPNGSTLLSGAGAGTSGLYCHIYDVASGREIITYRGHDNIVIATAISPDGLWAATGGGGNHEIHIWDLKTGHCRPGSDGQPLTFSGQGRPLYAVGFSEDARRIVWGQVSDYQAHNARGLLQHALTLPSATDILPRPELMTETQGGAFRRVVASQGGLWLQHSKGGNYGADAILSIEQGGGTVASIERGSSDGYGHWTYSFTSDGETIISGGGNGVLTAYDRSGKRLGDFIGHEGDVWAAAPSPDGRFLVSGSADETLRLWNLKTRELLVTFFHGADGEWVMWTPQGYYISSPDGDKYVGWQINRGPDKEADYVRASQLSRKLFRPDIIARTIELASAEGALAELGAPANIIDLLRVSRPPELRILLPESGAEMPDTPASIYVEVAPNPEPVEAYDITVNGRQVATRDLQFLGQPGERPVKKTLSVPLERGENAIRITVRNRVGASEPGELLLRFQGRGALDRRGALYVVAVGVDDYSKSKAKSLRYAGADARVFCEAMLRHAGPLHERAECLLLAKGGDRAPTRENIENAMLLFRKAEPQDTVALFLAGHGAYDGPNYVFLPQDTGSDGTHFLPASVVRWHVFQDALQTAQGRRLMFVDTCHSGGAYNTRLVKDAHDAEIVVFSATDSQTLAQEREELGHGAFTFALTQGLGGGAALGGDDIELSALLRYVSREVKGITKGAQSPEISLSKVKDFVIARKVEA